MGKRSVTSGASSGLKILLDIVSLETQRGRITNPDLEFSALFLDEANFPLVQSAPDWRVLAMESDNIPAVAWKFWEASTVNPALEDLLGLCSLHNQLFCFPSAVFYHPGPQNTMADEAS